MAAKRILVVDDHSDTREISQQLLTHFGYEVYVAEDGVEALDVALTAQPHLVLMDFLMPHGDGLQAIGMLKRHEPLRDVPVVLYTAAATEYNALVGAAGVTRVLLKPVEARQLLACVQDVIGPADVQALP